MSKVQGAKELERTMKILARKYPNAAMRAMYEEALLIFEMSQDMVPVDTNRLRLSGLVSFKDTFAEKVIFISYGTAYALRVHESAVGEKNRRARADKEAKTGKKQRGATKGQWKFRLRLGSAASKRAPLPA